MQSLVPLVILICCCVSLRGVHCVFTLLIFFSCVIYISVFVHHVDYCFLCFFFTVCTTEHPHCGTNKGRLYNFKDQPRTYWRIIYSSLQCPGINWDEVSCGEVGFEHNKHRHFSFVGRSSKAQRKPTDQRVGRLIPACCWHRILGQDTRDCV